jgi:hypothetical protein
MSDSALNHWEPPERFQKADRLHAIEAYLLLLTRMNSVWIAQWHGATLRMQHRGHHRHIRANQTYHQDKYPDRTFHSFSYVRVPWERKPSRGTDYTENTVGVKFVLQKSICLSDLD